MRALYLKLLNKEGSNKETSKEIFDEFANNPILKLSLDKNLGLADAKRSVGLHQKMQHLSELYSVTANKIGYGIFSSVLGISAISLGYLANTNFDTGNDYLLNSLVATGLIGSGVMFYLAYSLDDSACKYINLKKNFAFNND